VAVSEGETTKNYALPSCHPEQKGEAPKHKTQPDRHHCRNQTGLQAAPKEGWGKKSCGGLEVHKTVGDPYEVAKKPGSLRTHRGEEGVEI